SSAPPILRTPIVARHILHEDGSLFYPPIGFYQHFRAAAAGASRLKLRHRGPGSVSWERQTSSKGPGGGWPGGHSWSIGHARIGDSPISTNLGLEAPKKSEWSCWRLHLSP